MTDLSLHDWLTTPEALHAAEAAAYLVDDESTAPVDGEIGELISEAYAILVECAMPHPSMTAQSRYGVRARDGVPMGHLGSMWSWPVDQMEPYAVREIALVLRNVLRVRASELALTPA
jgi:hypothetical protein